MKVLNFVALLLLAQISFHSVSAQTYPPNQPLWTPKRSWVSDLNLADSKRLLGAQGVEEARLDWSGFVDPTLPEQLDWRNHNGMNWTTSVMNQGNCGSCVAFATVATLQTQMMISSGLPWLRPSYSPQALFACGGGSCDHGWMPQYGPGALQAHGIPDEACMPYTSGSTGDDVACSARCADSDARTLKIKGLKKVTGGVEGVKAALQHGPVYTSMIVYADFDSYGSGIYRHISGPSLGGHAVSIIGYDNAKQAWLIQNSWGKEWGEGGYAWISWADRSGVGAQAWSIEVGDVQNQISVVTPFDRMYVSGSTPLQSLNSPSVLGDGGAVTFFLKGKSSFKVDCSSATQGAQVKPSSCQVITDFSNMPEGRYEVFAQNKANTARSIAREFFVVHSLPKLSLSFTTANGLNLGSPLKDRPEFKVKVNFAEVPPQFIEFRVEDLSGKVIYHRASDRVLREMKLGFNTVLVPNGNYRIYYHAELPFNGQMAVVESAKANVTVRN